MNVHVVTACYSVHLHSCDCVTSIFHQKKAKLLIKISTLSSTAKPKRRIETEGGDNVGEHNYSESGKQDSN